MLLILIRFCHYVGGTKNSVNLFKKKKVHLLSAPFSNIFTMCFSIIALNPTALLEFRHVC